MANLKSVALVCEIFPQLRDKRNICGRNRIAGQVFWPDPRNTLAFLRAERPIPAPTDKQRHQEMKLAIVVRSKCEWSQPLFLNCNAEFLVELPRQALLWPFPGFNLATWKFPDRKSVV